MASEKPEEIVGKKEARIVFLEEQLRTNDTHENWFALQREISSSEYAQNDPEHKERLENLLKSSWWQGWSEKMNNREDRKVEQMQKLSKELGIDDMKVVEELLGLAHTDGAQFVLRYNALKNKN